MKKLLLNCLAISAFAASTPISNLPEITTPSTNTFLELSDQSATPKSRKVRADNLLGSTITNSSEITWSKTGLRLGGNVTGPLRIPDGAASAPGYSFDNDTASGMFLSLSNILSLTVKGGVYELDFYADLVSGQGTLAPADTTPINLGYVNNQWFSGAWISNVTVTTEPYDATGWNGDMTVPTKDAVRDKIESLAAGSSIYFNGTNYSSPNITNSATINWTLSGTTNWTANVAIETVSELESLVGANLIESSEFVASGLGGGTNNNLIGFGNLKFTAPPAYQIETLTGATPSMDWATQPWKKHFPTTNNTYAFASSPSDTNIGHPMFLFQTNGNAFTITNTWPASVHWPSDNPPTTTLAGKTLTVQFLYNGSEIQGFYNTTQTNPLTVPYGGSGLSGSTNGDLFTGNTGGSVFNVVKHPGSNGKMLYSTNAAPYGVWGDAPAGGSLPSQSFITKFAPLLSDGSSAYWGSPNTFARVVINEEFMAADYPPSGWNHSPDGGGTGGKSVSVTNAPGIAFLSAATGGADGEKLFFGLNDTDGVLPGSGEITVLARVRFPTLSTSGERYTSVIGLSTGSFGPDDSSEHAVCAFYNESTSANWKLTYQNGSTITTNTSSTAVTTSWQWIGLTIDPTGTNTVLYAASTLAAITPILTNTAATMPTSPIRPLINLRKSNSTAARTAEIDYYGAWIKFNNAR